MGRKTIFAAVLLVLGLVGPLLASNPITWTAPTDLTATNLQGFLMGIVTPFYGPLLGLGLLTTLVWTIYRVVRGGIRRRA